MEAIQDSYKDTKIGGIPKDWEVIKMGDVASLKNGANFSTKDVGEGRLMVNVKDLYDFKPFVKIVDETRVSNIADSYILKDGDLLFVRSSLVRDGVGFSAMFRDNGESTVYSGFIIRSRINSPKIFNPFVAYYLRSGLGRKNTIRLSGTVTITNIGQDALALLPIPVPPLPEQQKIAEILSTVDEQISTTQAIIDKSKELKKGLMQKLFSEGIGHTEFKDTKIGRIPKSWEISKLGEHCVKATKKFEPSKSNDSHKYIGLEHIISNAHRINGYGDSNDTLSTKTIFTKGEILYGKLRPYLNKVWRAKFNGVCTTEILVLKSKNEFDNGFLFYLLHNHRFIGHTISHTEGTSLPRANWKDISIFKIPLPSLSEQEKIADILSEADAKIEKEEQEKAHLEQLKKGLMQQLLTGQKRVKV